MVSVANSNPRRSAGFPFDEWSQTVSDTDELLESPRQPERTFTFQKIRTAWSIVVVLVVCVALETVLFVVPAFCEGVCGPPPHSILLYTHAALWFLFMLIDRLWRYEHYRSRTSGYLEFYRVTRMLRRTPILAFSGGTALLLIIATILDDYCPSEGTQASSNACEGSPLTRCNYIQIVASLEMAIIFPVTLIYLVKTVRFNTAQPFPDIHQDELVGSFSRTPSLVNGLGFRDEAFVDEILEKQADMIRYLKHHNTHLGRKILQLSTELDHSRTAVNT